MNTHIKKAGAFGNGIHTKTGAGLLAFSPKKVAYFKALRTRYYATEGEIKMFGSKGRRDLSRVRNKIGCTIENPAVYGDMTAKQNLELHRLQKGIQDRKCVDEVLKLVNLEKNNRKKAKHFSLGMKQRLAIGMALIGSPEFLILDEPVNGLDPTGIIELRELLVSLNLLFQRNFVSKLLAQAVNLAI